MEFMEVIKKRHSIRKFKSEPVSQEAIESILEAGRLAPSASNLQAWRYIIVKDAGVRAKLAKASPVSFFSTAPVIIICCIDQEVMRSQGARYQELQEAGAFLGVSMPADEVEALLKKMRVDELAIRANLAFNAAISITHMDLQAVDLGLGTCWIGLYDGVVLKELLDIDDRYHIVNVLLVGHPDQAPAARPRVKKEDIVIKEF
ncbi:nitroreductase family protein [Sporomusa sp. KB1]|jgi:nitroreductase|uniref:nitroreductase family protein n=1 Tax=Sporomusa sp. KB1 TaxID=943346 RepID=UPI00119DC440|nr:nitroreductase family protein [Sporomusa sp. KB1]TWH49400.1 nitroreductase [Sporomusa sp. KB1]